MGLFHSLIQKRVRKFLLVLPFLLTSCNYFNADFHRPVNIFEAYFLFKDSAGALYFEFEERLNGSFFKYGGQKTKLGTTMITFLLIEKMISTFIIFGCVEVTMNICF